MPQLDTIVFQIKFQIPGMGYILLSCWPAGFCVSPTLKVIVNAIGYPAQLDSRQ